MRSRSSGRPRVISALAHVTLVRTGGRPDHKTHGLAESRRHRTEFDRCAAFRYWTRSFLARPLPVLFAKARRPL